MNLDFSSDLEGLVAVGMIKVHVMPSSLSNQHVAMPGGTVSCLV